MTDVGFSFLDADAQLRVCHSSVTTFFLLLYIFEPVPVFWIRNIYFSDPDPTLTLISDPDSDPDCL